MYLRNNKKFQKYPTYGRHTFQKFIFTDFVPNNYITLIEAKSNTFS